MHLSALPMNWVQFPQLPELNSFRMIASVVLARDWGFLQMLHIPSTDINES